MPDDAKLNLPGAFLTAATSSRMLLTGSFGLTAMATPCCTMVATGVKSLTGSYPISLKIFGAAASEALAGVM